MTKFQIISDVILRISSAKPSDDLELEPKQVAFWIDQVLNALVKDTLDKRIKNKEGVDGEYITLEDNLSVSTATINGKATYYITLGHDPMNLYRDGGIIRVGNSDGLNIVDKAKMSEIDNLSQLKFSKPSLKNIQYSRVKNKLYLYGIDATSYAFNKFDVAYVPKTKVLEELTNTDIIYVSEDLIPIIAEKVTLMAKDELFNSGNDLTNDGTDDKPQNQIK